MLFSMWFILSVVFSVLILFGKILMLPVSPSLPNPLLLSLPLLKFLVYEFEFPEKKFKGNFLNFD